VTFVVSTLSSLTVVFQERLAVKPLRDCDLIIAYCARIC